MTKPDLIEAARAGDARAQLALAHFMITGRASAPSADEPLRLVRAACAQEFDEALLYHASLAALGVGREQSLEDAYAYLCEAAALGHRGARGQLHALGGGALLDAAPWLSPPALKQHAAAPRLFTAENFLPNAACEWLIQQGGERLHRALVRTGSTSSSEEEGRTNSVAGSSMLEPDLVMQLARLRIAAAIGQSVSQLEPTNILHYDVGQEYKPHYDIIRPEDLHDFEADLRAHGQRLVTVLVYLNEGYEGGETGFPRLERRFKGKPGDALIFWNLSAAGDLERDSLHAGLPVTRGEKWLLSQWVRQRPLPLR
ncbi:MAG: 2OG-Fe(II) oxygenase [Proteobacteria bacterium]|nr:2OG-Fe(II) oxygenase [Pseudomonadota bacterium]